jgi:hypothetical protein
MKETEPNHKDITEQHAEKQIEKKTVLVGSKKLRPGHKCFEINIFTEEVAEAKYEAVAHYHLKFKRKIIIKIGHVYVNALNAKNALKVYYRDYAQLRNDARRIQKAS